MSWFRKLLPPKIKRESTQQKKAVPEGLWSKCPSCEAVLYFTDLENNLHVCPKCNFHNRLSARQRLDLFFDEEGRDISVTDGQWVIIFGLGGWLRYLAEYGLMTAPMGRSPARCPKRSWRGPSDWPGHGAGCGPRSSTGSSWICTSRANSSGEKAIWNIGWA